VRPSTSTGAPGNIQGLTIDATILALNDSFGVNNYSQSNNEGQLTVYGSIQQNARGAVGQGGGYVKYYTWDPRLTLYGPPTTWHRARHLGRSNSSAESYTGPARTCPGAANAANHAAGVFRSPPSPERRAVSAS